MAVIVDVVNSEKKRLFFSATSALITVGLIDKLTVSFSMNFFKAPVFRIVFLAVFFSVLLSPRPV